MNHNYQEQIHSYIHSHKTEILNELKELICIPSVKDEVSSSYPYGKECAKILDVTKALYEKHGFETKADHQGGYLLSYLGNGEKTLGLFAHADVVAAGDDWVLTSPFEPIEKDGFLVGRGVADDKSAVITSLYCMKMIKELKLPFQSRLVCFTGISEESGMQDIENYRKTHTPPDFALICDSDFPLYRGNKGMFQATAVSEQPLTDILDFHGGKSFNIILGKATARLRYTDTIYQALKEKETGQLTIEQDNDTILITANGISTHGAFPEGSLNAGYLIASALAECEALNANDRHQMEYLKKLLSSPYGEALKISHTDPDFGKLTSTNGIIRMENGCLTLVFDIRFGVLDTKKLQDDISASLAKNNYRVSFSGDTATHILPEDLPEIKACMKVYQEYTDTSDAKTLVNAGGTYGRHLPCAVEIGVTLGNYTPPFTLPVGHGKIHQPDEYLPIDGFLNALEITMLMLLECDH